MKKEETDVCMNIRNGPGCTRENTEMTHALGKTWFRPASDGV